MRGFFAINAYRNACFFYTEPAPLEWAFEDTS